MLILDFVLSGLLGLCLILSIYWGVLNRRRYLANITVADELDRVMGEAVALVHNNQALNDSLKKKESSGSMTVADLYKSPTGHNGDVDLESQEMLSTILTVIIHKYGSAKLSLKDFQRLPDGEYVSVYVDSKSNKLILSMDHNLADKNPLDMVSFTNSDDSTFH
mgnify:FL=1